MNSTNHEASRGREAQRLETRRRVLAAAKAEYMDRGMAGADLVAITSAAAVGRGTFYYHFPSREHVLLEVEAEEGQHIACALQAHLRTGPDLRSALLRSIELVADMEQRVSPILFKDLLALRFSPSRPIGEEWRLQPTVATVAQLLRDAERDEAVELAIDPYHSAVFFLLGLYGVLAVTTDNEALRTVALEDFLTSTLRSLRP